MRVVNACGEHATLTGRLVQDDLFAVPAAEPAVGTVWFVPSVVEGADQCEDGLVTERTELDKVRAGMSSGNTREGCWAWAS